MLDQNRVQMDKYQKGRFIIPDRRYSFDFHLTFRRADKESTRKVSTRADTLKAAEELVRNVAMTLVQEDGWESYALAPVER